MSRSRLALLIATPITILSAAFWGYILSGGVMHAARVEGERGEKADLARADAEIARAEKERERRRELEEAKLRASVCELRVKGVPEMYVPVFPSEDGLKLYQEAQETRDTTIINDARRAGGAWLVEPGIECERVGGSLFDGAARVEIGSGPHRGKRGWTLLPWTYGER